MVSNAQKILTLTVAQGLSVGLAFSFNAVLAQTSSVAFVGDYVAFVSILNIGVLVLDFGLFAAIPVLCAKASGKAETSAVIGLMNLLVIGVGLLSLTCLWVAQHFLKFSFLETFSGASFLIFLVLLPYASREVFLQVGKGLTNIRILTISRLATPSILLIGYGLFYLTKDVTLKDMVVLHGVAGLGLLLTVNLIYRPSLHDLLPWKKELLSINKSYGIFSYLSRLMSSGWLEFLTMFIYFVGGAEAAAFYRIGLLVVSPIIMISQNTSTYFFRSFGQLERLENRVVLFNTIILLGLGGLLFLMGPHLITLVFGSSYEQSILPMQICLIGAIATGLYQLPSAFFNAKARGIPILISSALMAATAMFVMLLIVPVYGAVGGALSYAAGCTAYVISINYFYMMWQRQHKSV